MVDDDTRSDGPRSPGSTGIASTYEVAPTGLDRPSGRGPAVVATIAALFLALVVIKPWDLPTGPDPGTAFGPIATPDPSQEIARPARTETPMMESLASRSGTWGVGSSGFGPRYDGDPWVAWEAVQPLPAGDTPNRIMTWPGTGICTGLPVLPEGPTFITVTNPHDVPADRQVVAWWTDGGRTAWITDSIRQVNESGDHGISYLVRLDQATWPAGRYEFHLEAGDRAVELSVCLSDVG